jgi:hypothetical protein
MSNIKYRVKKLFGCSMEAAFASMTNKLALLFEIN